MSSDMRGELRRELAKQEAQLAVEMNLRMAMDMRCGDEMLFVECVECIEVAFPRADMEETREANESPMHPQSRFRKLRERVRGFFSRAGKQKNKKK